MDLQTLKHLVPLWVWAGIWAGLCFTGVEALNRGAGFSSFFHALRVTGLLVILGQWGIFYAYRDAPKMLMAWGVFAFTTASLRVISARFFFNEEVRWQAMVGIAGMLFCGWLIKEGTK